MLTLIVKGNESEARKACEYNGIAVTSATAHDKFNETTIRTDAKFEHDVQKWFITSCRDDERKPIPIGSLLWYGEAFNLTPDLARRIAELVDGVDFDPDAPIEGDVGL